MSDIQKNELKPPHVRTKLPQHERSVFKRDKRDRKCTPVQNLLLFLFKFSNIRSPKAPWLQSCVCERQFPPLTPALIQVEEMSGRVMELKMINAPFCPSWHLEHICSSGIRTDMASASGTEPPFAPPQTPSRGCR